MATKIKLQDVYHKISLAKCEVQYVRFFKKSTGEERHMMYKVAGKDDRSGEAVPIHRVLDDVALEILTVYDLNAKDYRRINLSSVISLVIDNEEYEVVP